MQTPQFTISNAEDGSVDVGIELTVRNGVLTDGYIRNRAPGTEARIEMSDHAAGRKVHEVSDWDQVLLEGFADLEPSKRAKLSMWLASMLPMPGR